MKFPKLTGNILAFLSYGPRIRPFRDWSVLICVGIILLLVSALWNAWLFYRVANGEALGSTATTTSTGFTTESLSKAEKIFSGRAAEEARYRSEYHFVDPSL